MEVDLGKSIEKISQYGDDYEVLKVTITIKFDIGTRFTFKVQYPDLTNLLFNHELKEILYEKYGSYDVQYEDGYIKVDFNNKRIIISTLNCEYEINGDDNFDTLISSFNKLSLMIDEYTKNHREIMYVNGDKIDLLYHVDKWNWYDELTLYQNKDELSNCEFMDWLNVDSYDNKWYEHNNQRYRRINNAQIAIINDIHVYDINKFKNTLNKLHKLKYKNDLISAKQPKSDIDNNENDCLVHAINLNWLQYREGIHPPLTYFL